MALHEFRRSARSSLLYETDKEHPKNFTMCVHVDDERYEGTGPTKQKAKYHAAKAALQKAFHANFPEETVTGTCKKMLTLFTKIVVVLL